MGMVNERRKTTNKSIKAEQKVNPLLEKLEKQFK